MTARPTDGLDEQLLRNPKVRRGKMFGHPAYYVNGRLFACVYGKVLGLKLPEGLVSDLIAHGRAEPFQPYGKRKMREWIQLPLDQALSHDHGNTIQASLSFVKGLGR